MTIEEAIEWIHQRTPINQRPGLKRVKHLLKLIGEPQKKIPTIHIAGTNGKGSTVTYLRCLMQNIGLTVGTFTSPYISYFNERISINGQGIPDQQLISYVEKYQQLIAQMDENEQLCGITEFELLTVMAFDYFYTAEVDILLLEVGIGGRWDSTNVCCPILTAITTIGEDHIDILGATLEKIAYQKAGIIKKDVPVVTGKISESALAVVRREANTKHSQLHCLGEVYHVNYQVPTNIWGETFGYQSTMSKFPLIQIPLAGKHQTENAGLAIRLFELYCTLEHHSFFEEDIYQGLCLAKWPGRMEIIDQKPLIILDGAHNVHAVKYLIENLNNRFADRKVHILFSALVTKDVDQMLSLLTEPSNTTVHITTFDYPKAICLKEWADYFDEQCLEAPDWQAAIADFNQKQDTNEVLIITGSLYFVSQVRQFLSCLESNTSNNSQSLESQTKIESKATVKNKL